MPLTQQIADAPAPTVLYNDGALKIASSAQITLPNDNVSMERKTTINNQWHLINARMYQQSLTCNHRCSNTF